MSVKATYISTSPEYRRAYKKKRHEEGHFMRSERKEYVREYYRRNKKRIQDYQRKWRQSIPLEKKRHIAEKVAAYRRARLVVYPEWQKENIKRCRAKLREEIIRAYGGKCSCCGEDTEEFLTIDHVNGDGNKERKELGPHIYNRLRREGFPKDRYRLLCMNCNWCIGRRGYCPHQKGRRNVR